jgi:hypothetical protein
MFISKVKESDAGLYFSVYSRCYETNSETTAGKHVSDIRAIARQPLVATIGEMLRAVFFFWVRPGAI